MPILPLLKSRIILYRFQYRRDMSIRPLLGSPESSYIAFSIGGTCRSTALEVPNHLIQLLVLAGHADFTALKKSRIILYIFQYRWVMPIRPLSRSHASSSIALSIGETCRIYRSSSPESSYIAFSTGGTCRFDRSQDVSNHLIQLLVQAGHADSTALKKSRIILYSFQYRRDMPIFPLLRPESSYIAFSIGGTCRFYRSQKVSNHLI